MVQDGVRDRDLVLVQEIRQGAEAFRAVADDRRRFSITRSEAKTFECRVHAVVLRGVYVVRLPVKRCEHTLEIRHRKDHSIGKVELTVIVIDQHAQVIQVFLACVHDGFPDRPLLHLAVAAEHI